MKVINRKIRKMGGTLTSLVILLTAILTAPANAIKTHAAEQTLPSGLENVQLEEKVDEYVEKHERTTAGMAVAVFDGTDELFKKYYGYVDVEDQIAVSEDSVFEWGSATKLLVWVSVMQLYEQGKLELDRDISHYLPDGFLSNLSYDMPVTMLNLMNHTAWYQDLLVDLFIKEKYKKAIYIIITLYIIFLAAFPAAVFILTNSLPAVATSAAGMLLLCILSYALNKADDKYISGIVTQLSELMDILLFINEKEIFPDNEDTVLSKLQNKVIKLYKILKNRSIREEQEHENIKKLVSDISHQLKTPIANLKMYSSFLNDVQLTARQQKEYIDIICLSVERLNFLSENIIKVSRLEGGIIKLKMHRQSINGTVLKAVKDIYTRAQQKRIEIRYNESGRIELCHDRNWTAEAIFNLLDNAIKYGRPGNIVYLSIKQYGMFAEIAVKDENGVIPYEERNNIFKRFYRGKNSRRQEGIGIGLYLAREIIVKQKGYINLKSSKDGNIFSIMLYIEANFPSC